jgi:hypothetical protein
MRKTVIAFALAGAFSMFIQAGDRKEARTSTRTETRVSPTAEQGEFQVEIHIIGTDVNGRENRIAAPKLTLRAGQKGTLAVGEANNGIQCSAQVDDMPGKTEATVSVKVTQKGLDAYNATQTVVVNK